MPKFNVILNLPDFSIKKVSGYQPILLDLVNITAAIERSWLC